MLHEQQKKALKAAFPHTVPNLTGFLFLGFAYGIYMHSAGLSVVYTFFMASLIYGGSLELLAVGFLLGPFAPLETLFLAIMIQLRHLFYGIAMLGLGVSILSLVIFKAEHFILPAMLGILSIFLLAKPKLERQFMEAKESL